MNLNKSRIALGLLLLAFLLLLYPIKLYKAGQRLRLREPLYQFDDPDRMYKYLPGAAILEAPFSMLPYNTSRFLFYAMTALCTLGVLALSYTLLPQRAETSILLPVLTLVILAKYFFRELYLGQINVVMTFFLLLMIWCLRQTERTRAAWQDIAAGCLWALATTLKPYALVWLPYFVVRRHWLTFLSGVGCMCLALLAPIWFYGFAGNLALHRTWAFGLSQTTPDLLSHHDIISLLTFFMKWAGQQTLSFWLSLAITACLAILMLILIAKGRETDQPVVLEGAILLILIPLLAPLAWYNILLMAVLGVMLLLQYYTTWTSYWRLILVVNFGVIALSLYDLMGKTLYHRFMDWSPLTISGLLLVGYLASLRFRRIC